MHYMISEVAEMVGISVRMLHHYDKIGLLKPGSVSPAGYRLYSDKELERLQQVLFFKELDFSLQEIKKILDNPGFDRKEALRAQRRLLSEKKRRLEKIIETVDRALGTVEGGADMDKKMFEAFDMSEIERHKEKYAEETRQKYGDSDAYKESQRRTSAYTKEDWACIMKKGDEIYKRIVSLMDKGPSDPEVQTAVGDWRQHITDSYYNCTPEIFRGLGELYVNDERFTRNIDKYAKGLAAFLSEAISIYCDNLNK